jgi:hypothetical protein
MRLKMSLTLEAVSKLQFGNSLILHEKHPTLGPKDDETLSLQGAGAVFQAALTDGVQGAAAWDFDRGKLGKRSLP